MVYICGSSLPLSAIRGLLVLCILDCSPGMAWAIINLCPFVVTDHFLHWKKRTPFGEDHGIHNRLIGWSKIVKPKVDEDFKKIRNLKSQRCDQRYEDLEPWDETYFTGMMKSSAYNLDSTVISYYFPLSQCNEGLKVLVQSLFGATFHSIPLAPGESCHEDVLKMSLHHPKEVVCMGLPISEEFAEHYLTGEVIPEEVVESMKGARNIYARRKLTSLIALALNLEESFFDKVGALHAPMAFLGLQHYPAELSALEEEVYGASAHSDYGMITLLATDGIRGLQICREKDKRPHTWEDVYHSNGYIYAKCLAATIWADVCAKDPLSVTTGTTLRAKLLQYGGAKEASTLLKDLVGSDDIQRYHGKVLVPNLTSLCQEMGLIEDQE
ncbi:hypothetical protein GIB67_014086 [Kingdonia uniflora]|uniref:Peptidase M3A/M3B catalytic domain-containing protein n=1 Tax=Kingdonia uniflora TaxID=39325 RepID=A0A7J7KXH4_9MAGN|nr:hypothetical protein GIB67_014086 [Kingdonia uniflora]